MIQNVKTVGDVSDWFVDHPTSPRPETVHSLEEQLTIPRVKASLKGQCWRYAIATWNSPTPEVHWVSLSAPRTVPHQQTTATNRQRKCDYKTKVGIFYKKAVHLIQTRELSSDFETPISGQHTPQLQYFINRLYTYKIKVKIFRSNEIMRATSVQKASLRVWLNFQTIQ